MKNTISYESYISEISIEEALYQHTYLDFVESDMYFENGASGEDKIDINYNGTVLCTFVHSPGTIIDCLSLSLKLGIIKQIRYDQIIGKSKDIKWLHARYYDKLDDNNKEGARIEMNIHFGSTLKK